MANKLSFRCSRMAQNHGSGFRAVEARTGEHRRVKRVPASPDTVRQQLPALHYQFIQLWALLIDHGQMLLQFVVHTCLIPVNLHSLTSKRPIAVKDRTAGDYQ
jgi:hypothetical protein